MFLGKSFLENLSTFLLILLHFFFDPIELSNIGLNLNLQCPSTSINFDDPFNCTVSTRDSMEKINLYIQTDQSSINFSSNGIWLIFAHRMCVIFSFFFLLLFFQFLDKHLNLLTHLLKLLSCIQKLFLYS